MMSALHALFRSRHALPLIMQSEVNECGLACLAMLASYHGKLIDIVTLRSRFRLAAAGASVQHLLQAATGLELQGRALKLELSELPALTLPIILHWDMDHFVVLKQIRRQRCTIHNPAVGVRHYPLDELGGHFTGIAIEFAPLSTFIPEKLTRDLSLRQLLPASRRYLQSGLQIFLLSLLLQVLALLSPLYLQLVIDQGVGKGDMALLPLLFFIVLLSRAIVGYFRGVLSMQFSNQLGFQMLGNMFDHLLRLPLGFFERREMGDIVSRFSALENIKQLLTHEVITIVVDGLFSSLSLLLLFLYSPLLAGVAFLFMALFILLRVLCIPLEKQRRQEALITGASQQSRFMENIRSIVTRKNYALERQRVGDWQSAYAGYLNSGYHLGHFQLTVNTLQSLLFGIDNLLTLYLGALAVGSGQLTLGQLMSFIFLKQHFTSAVTAMLPKLTELGLVKLELERVADISQHPPEFAATHENLLQQQVQGAITVTDLCFRYADSDPLLLDHLSFTLAAGSSVAIVGKSGSGKSTLLKLLLGLAQAESGSICIDGIGLAQLGIRRYREQVAVIMHNEGLLAGDLAYNIRLQHGGYELERLHSACARAGVLDLIQRLPLGFNTQIGEMGNAFSAGQVQRLLLARAFYRNPHILILDEALSHLGHDAALQMFKGMCQQGMTVLLVTHNPQLADLADQRIELSSSEKSTEQLSKRSLSNASH